MSLAVPAVCLCLPQCVVAERTHRTSQWPVLLRFFFIKGFAVVILYDCLRQSLPDMFLCARHYGKCKNVTSEFMKLVLHVCPCVCVYVYLCMDMLCACVSKSLWRPEADTGCLSSCSHPYFLRQGFSESRTHPFSEIGCILSSRAGPVSVSPLVGL